MEVYMLDVPVPAEGLTFEKVWAMFQETDRKFQETDRQFRETSRQFRETELEIKKTQQIIRENAIQQKKTEELVKQTSEQQKKTDEQMKKTDEQMKQTDERMKQTDELVKQTSEQQKKTDEQMRRTDERMKRTDERLERLAENLGGLGRSLGELVETLIAARLWEKFASYPYNLKRAYRRIPLYNEKSRPISEIDILLSDTEWVMAVEVKREAVPSDVDHHLKRMELIRKYPPAETVGKRLIGAIAAGELAPGTREYAHEAGFFVLELSGESVSLIQPPEGFQPREWRP
jgi:hypothetical protein